MASSASLSSFLFLTFLLLLCVSASHSSPHNNNNNNNDVAREPAPPVVTRKNSPTKNKKMVQPQDVPVCTQKVDMSFYYETLCPGSQDFIVKLLPKAINSDLLLIVNLSLVPWGNAQLQSDNVTVLCQHGEEECYLNTIHACAISLWPDVETYFSFIYCIEQSLSGSQSGAPEPLWKNCAYQHGLSEQDILHCYESGHGKQLVMQYGKETRSLIPPLEFVPWVVVNGIPLREELDKFVEYVCEEYEGKVKPKACKAHSHLLPTNSIKEEKPLHELVCHADEPRSAKDSSQSLEEEGTP